MPKLSRVVARLAESLHRMTSLDYRVYTDTLQEPYVSQADWMSGVGSCIHVLYALALTIQPATIVEIGSARGRTTCLLSLACRQNRRGKVFAIDPHDGNVWADANAKTGTYEFLTRRIRRYHLEAYCEVVRMTSDKAAKEWNRPVDLIFIDGDHTYDGVKRDFELFRPWLTPNSIVAFHDTLWEYLPKVEDSRGDLMGVPKYMDELRLQGFNLLTLWTAPGLTVMNCQQGGFPLFPTQTTQSLTMPS